MKSTYFSRTAAFVAIKFYGLTKDRKIRALFNQRIVGFYDRIVHWFPYPLHLFKGALKINPVRKFFVFWDEFLLPGDLMHVALRKWYLSTLVRQAKDDGYEQLIVLGAGFDHLAALYNDQNFVGIELDLPQMAEAKRAFLNANNYEKKQLYVVDTYLNRSSIDRIFWDEPTIASNKKTVIVAEGFFDYLSADELAATLHQLGNYFDQPVRLLNTVFSRQELSPLRSFIYRKSVRLADERLALQLNKTGYFDKLKEANFSLEKCIDTIQMKAEVLGPHNINQPILDGFYVLQSINNV